MQCCLWFHLIIWAQSPWPKHYSYHLSIIITILTGHYGLELLVLSVVPHNCTTKYCIEVLYRPRSSIGVFSTIFLMD